MCSDRSFNESYDITDIHLVRIFFSNLGLLSPLSVTGNTIYSSLFANQRNLQAKTVA